MGYNPDQPRDYHGRFGGGGADAAAAKAASVFANRAQAVHEFKSKGLKGSKVSAEGLPNDMSSSERQVLEWYSGSGASVMNGALRGYHAAGPQTKESIDRLTGVLERASLPRDTVVWRGVASKDLYSKAESLIGHEIEDKGFMSTSVNKAAAKQFMSSTSGAKVLFKILVPQGSQAAHVSAVSSFKHEKEVIINRSTRIKVTNVLRFGGIKRIEAVVVGHGGGK